MAECLDSLGSLTVRKFWKGRGTTGKRLSTSSVLSISFFFLSFPQMWWLRQFVWGLQQVVNNSQIFVSQKDIEIHHLSIIHFDLQRSLLFVSLLYGQKGYFFLLFPVRLNTKSFVYIPSVIFSMWISYKPYNWLHLTSIPHLLLFLPCVTSFRSSNKLFAKTSLA